MARTLVEKPSETLPVARDQTCRTGSALPISGLTYATRLRQYRLAADNLADATQRTIIHSPDASLNVRGILISDQRVILDGAQSLDESSDLTYVKNGPGRLVFEAAVAKHVRFCAGTNGYARAWVAGVDNVAASLGRTESTGTAALDIVDVEINLAFNGV